MKVSRVISLVAAQVERGRALAATCNTPFIDAHELAAAKPRHIEDFVRSQLDVDSSAAQYVFIYTAAGLVLAQITARQLLSIRADFYGSSVSYRRLKGGGKGQMIAKAVGLGSGEPLRVLDATAGLGRDAFVLASLGCALTLIERVPEVRVLLDAALSEAREWGDVKDAALSRILERMHLLEADALEYMRKLDPEHQPDVVYLDPMFPARNKSSLVKKEMRVFHDLVGEDPDADRLLEAAMACAKKRVVVKRPRIAPELAGLKPSYTLQGKSNRFDIYATH